MSPLKSYEIHALVKRYESPGVLANDRISFTTSPGEAFGLLGPNGAGKSTLVRQLVGLSRPTSGTIHLFGELVSVDGRSHRRIGRTVAYLPQGALSLGELKVAEAISSTGRMRGIGKTTARAETEALLDTLQISDLAERQVRKLSGGQRRLTQLAMTFVGRLPVVILDEPTADLDVVARQRVWDLISDRCAEGATVILVTHDVAEAERALHRVAILDQGKVVTSGTPAELKAKLAHRTRLEILVAEGADTSADALAAHLGGDALVRGRHVSAWVPADEAVRSLEKVMSHAGPEALEDVHLITPTLEDVYLELRGQSLQEADEGDAGGPS